MTRWRRALSDLDQDIRDHLERETQENIERGMSPADAIGCSITSSLTVLSRHTTVTPLVLTGVMAKMICSAGIPGRKNTPI